jgi:putative PIN family toxin of toxin-antitoxin system
MIVVIDTNVLVSAFLSPRGAPAAVFARWMQGAFDVAVSPQLLSELARVLTYEQVRKHTRHSDEDIRGLLERYQASAVFVEPDFTLSVIVMDPADNRVLECAVSAGAAFIVSGDQHLLDLKAFQEIVVLPPAGFLVVLEQAG